MFGTATTTAGSLLADVSAVSGTTFNGLYGWVIVALGIPLAFVLARYVISLFKHGVGRSSGR